MIYFIAKWIFVMISRWFISFKIVLLLSHQITYSIVLSALILIILIALYPIAFVYFVFRVLSIPSKSGKLVSIYRVMLLFDYFICKLCWLFHFKDGDINELFLTKKYEFSDVFTKFYKMKMAWGTHCDVFR